MRRYSERTAHSAMGACGLVLAVWLSAQAERASAGEQVGERGIRIEERAAERFDRGRKWAIVIGANEYLDPRIPNLKYCVADAKLVAKTLSDSCSYDANRILTITDDQEKAKLRPIKINLDLQIAEWLKQPSEDDTVLMFFSGHGMRDPHGQGFLAPQDCRFDQLATTGFRIVELREMLRQCKARRKLLVLDCCHAGGEKGIATARASSAELGRAFREASGLITLASCGPQEWSQEWAAKGHGLFSYFLVKGLLGAADFDRNRLVDCYELHRYTYDEVRHTAWNELNAHQSPKLLIREDVTGVFALSRVLKSGRFYGGSSSRTVIGGAGSTSTNSKRPRVRDDVEETREEGTDADDRPRNRDD